MIIAGGDAASVPRWTMRIVVAPAHPLPDW
jgi:hypothetical protein